MDTSFLDIQKLKKYYRAASGLGETKRFVKAVDGVSFSVKRDKVFALVGESGCGKSTVARLILKLIDPTGGRVLFKGHDIAALKGDSLRAFRRSVQIVFQDPFASLNPRMCVLDTLGEPFIIHKLVPKKQIRENVVALLEKVGLGPDALMKYPHEFSGGQRQRICIARALTVSPELIIADEPLSALDVSIQAQILNLFQQIRQDSGITLVFISHDLNVVQYLSDEVGVMYLGGIVELAGNEDLFSTPKHPYTELLLSSVPKITTDRTADHSSRIVMTGTQADIPSQNDVPPGCPFHPRCQKRFALCDKDVPVLKEFGGRQVACHLY
ncbi:MAG TPA: oligopeptide/dipeptide ABC transporter ATP-binding protein [Dissulfurispiraceae bacterium]|nr:oligopeptide/dipeptide ABC transporter ATP-binding protein [Dissulfurispiraceae bacterium]